MTAKDERTFIEAAKAGALVWTICAAAEAVAVQAASALGTRGHGIGLAWVGFEHPWQDVGIAAGGLALYPIAGALAAMVVAAGALAHSATRRLVAGADPRLLWRSIAAFELACAYTVHVAFVRQPALASALLVTLASGLIGLAAVRDPSFSRRPVVHVAIVGFPVSLVSGAFASCRWPWGDVLPGALVGAAAAGAVVAVPAAVVGMARSRLAAVAGGRRSMRVVWGVTSTTLLSVFVALQVVGASPSSPRDAKRARVRSPRPNVLLVTLDTVRADHLSVYGYGRDTTPNLAVLPATVYERQIASSNWTVPTHASILTGQSPGRHGAHRAAGTAARGLRLADASVTLAEVLKDAGYDTRAVVANTAVLLPALGFSRGFDVYERPVAEGPLVPIPDRFLLQSPLRRVFGHAFGETREYASADEVNRLAVDALEDASRTGKPFFLWLNYMDAHSPYAPPAPFDRRYPGKDPSFNWSGFTELVRDVSVQHSRPLTPSEAGHLTSQYDGAIAYLDEALSRLLQQLRALGVYDNTLIIVTADHGESLGEKSLLAHGRSLNQSQIWVPLLVKYPGQTRRDTVAVSTSDTDVLPTVLDVVGHQPVDGAEGHSLRGVAALEARWVTAESYEPRGAGFTSRDGSPDEMALFAGRMKLVVGAGGGMELYDLQADPVELENLSNRRTVPPEWLHAIEAAMASARRLARPAAPVDEDLLERLRGLNYIR